MTPPQVLLAFGPQVYPSVLRHPERMPKWDFDLGAEVRHSVASIGWDEPLPPNLDSFNNAHGIYVGSIGRYVTEFLWERELNPLVIAGTAYTDPAALMAAPHPKEPALIADLDQLVCSLREGRLHGVILAHLLTVAATGSAYGRSTG